MSISPSISPLVDADYRLHAADLAGFPRHVVIANVTYQGIEEMRPVLHFEGQTKRLVLSPGQVNQLIDITGTVLSSRWIGVPLILQPSAKGEAQIAILPVTHKLRGQPMPVTISEDRRGWLLAISIVGVLLSISLLFAFLNLPMLVATLQELRDNWPLR